MTPIPALDPRQQRLVEEYLKDLNATQAYRRAGHTGGKPGQGALDALSRHLGLGDPTVGLAEDLRAVRERQRGCGNHRNSRRCP